MREPALSFSLLLLCGPFHCTIAFPRSSRNMSPLLKLFHDTSTCTRHHTADLYLNLKTVTASKNNSVIRASKHPTASKLCNFDS